MFNGFRKIVYERRLGGLRTAASLLFVFPLLLLCGVLGVLQYRWIGAVSIAEESRLRANLQLSLARISEDFDAELTRDCRSFAGLDGKTDGTPPEEQIASRYAKWRSSTSHQTMFRRIAVTSHVDGAIVLHVLDLDKGTFTSEPWPPEWQQIRQRVELGIPARLPSGRRFEAENAAGSAFEVPLVPLPDPGSRPPDPLALRSSMNWIIFDFNQAWLLGNLLPELVQIHLGSGGKLDYLVQVIERSGQHAVLFESNPDRATSIASSADASVSLFNLSLDQIIRPPVMRDAGRISARGPRSGFGRWQMFVRHRSGSLDAVVAMARRRNMAVTGGVLFLMTLSAAALVHFSRRTQKLAELEMNFVTGISHELRTPLSVIHLAAHNLETNVTNDPAQVARYGVLIRQESRRLGDLVEQVLRFASVKAGRTLHEWKPLSVTDILERAIESSWTDLPRKQYTVEKHIDAELPAVIGDRLALEHAFQNLLTNAARHAMKVNPWVAVSVSTSASRSEIEVRISDRGPGIPAIDRSRIFDPFFRGQRAIDEQIHGTGLGLSLVRNIIEAHGGTIDVTGPPAGGAEFIIRLPVLSQEQQRELTDSVSRG
jgi:signal transduction histidine kinase